MKKITFICLLTLLASCTHKKVQVNKFSDTNLSCNEIVTETNQMHEVLADINSKTGFSGRNVGMGLLFWPGIFVNQMNASDAEKLAQKRLDVLNSLYKDKNCHIETPQKK
jgi:hypothetical protein